MLLEPLFGLRLRILKDSHLDALWSHCLARAKDLETLPSGRVRRPLFTLKLEISKSLLLKTIWSYCLATSQKSWKTRFWGPSGAIVSPQGRNLEKLCSEGLLELLFGLWQDILKNSLVESSWSHCFLDRGCVLKA